METRDFAYHRWMKPMLGRDCDTQRLEEIVARYAHLLFSSDRVLSHVSLDELSWIGSLLQDSPSSHQGLLFPYSFADLCSDTTPSFQRRYNKLPFALQCKILDTAREFSKALPPYAMIAMDWDSAAVQLLALSASADSLHDLSLAFLCDPLTETMVDETHEAEKAFLLHRAKHLLETRQEERRVGIYSVTCSDELFVNNLFSNILDCEFSLQMGEQKDRWHRFIPEHITEASEAQAPLWQPSEG